MTTVGIIGSGVIGEAAGRGFAKHGIKTIFVDINSEKINKLRSEGFAAMKPEGILEEKIDVYLISIQTPTLEDGVSLEAFKKPFRFIGEAIKNHSGYPVVATRSTVPVGTAKEIVAPLLEEYSGKKAWKDFGVASNPEFLREAKAFEDFLNPNAILIGHEDEKSKEILTKLYSVIDAPIYFMKTMEAEMQKYTHNLFNACKISFFNEQRLVCEQLGLDADKIFEVVAETAEGSYSKKYGLPKMAGYRGACLPKDTKGFIDYAKKKIGFDMIVMKAVDDLNEIWKKKVDAEAEEH